jgi:transglutaminase-like putative cysteine protease
LAVYLEPDAPLPLDLSVRVGCELVYVTQHETSILVLFKPRHSQTQLIREERTHFEPVLIPSEFEDEHGNIAYRMLLRPGRNLLRHDAIVKVPSTPPDLRRVDGVVPPHLLPPEVLRYTLPSRYADSDKLLDFAWRNFGHVENGLTRVQAICDWTHRNIEYRTGSGNPQLSAADVIARGYGVCRDFAHVAQALCRTFNIPARYTTGHIPDIGVVDPGTPFDFHAYFEVYVAHRWQVFDARYNQPRIGRIRIASGLDATNCAFSTIYGAAKLERFEVWAYQVDPRRVSTSDPVDLKQRLDGTEELRFSSASYPSR